jgi:hypothetical protein
MMLDIGLLLLRANAIDSRSGQSDEHLATMLERTFSQETAARLGVGAKRQSPQSEGRARRCSRERPVGGPLHTLPSTAAVLRSLDGDAHRRRVRLAEACVEQDDRCAYLYLREIESIQPGFGMKSCCISGRRRNCVPLAMPQD